MSLKDKVVIVTGGGSGICLATALAFNALEANVLITGRRGHELDEIVTGEPRLNAVVADVSDPLAAPRTIARAVELWGRLDVLVNNAGVGAPIALTDASARQSSAIYAVNAVGPTLLAAAALPYLEASQGSIINVSSTYGRKAIAGFADYAASKAALEQLTRCWALELAPKGASTPSHRARWQRHSFASGWVSRLWRQMPSRHRSAPSSRSGGEACRRTLRTGSWRWRPRRGLGDRPGVCDRWRAFTDLNALRN